MPPDGINVGVNTIADRRLHCRRLPPTGGAYRKAIEEPAKLKGISDSVPAAIIHDCRRRKQDTVVVIQISLCRESNLAQVAHVFCRFGALRHARVHAG